MVMSADNIRGLALALSSSFFIGSSFIVKKKGLKKAGTLGVRAGSGGFSYLYEPLWWAGMISMIVGEIANFAAYAFAPAILVTPLGALSIIVSAVLAHFCLDEKLHIFGILGCVLCMVGSTSIVLHAPKERDIESVKQLWQLATEPGFIAYSCVVVLLVLILIFRFVPRYGQTHMLVYIGICSLMGSLTVMSVKALGIALKLSFLGMNQFIYAQTWFFTAVVVICCLTQMNYLNRALDTFNTAVISPVYYVMFTTFTIFASMIMFKDWASQDTTQIISELCGFFTILSGTFLLHKTKDMGSSATTEPTDLNETEHQNEVSSSESLSTHIVSPMEAYEKCFQNLHYVYRYEGHTIALPIQYKNLYLWPGSMSSAMSAGRTVETVLYLAGFSNVKTKIIGSRNPLNVVKALFKASYAIEAPKGVQEKFGRNVVWSYLL